MLWSVSFFSYSLENFRVFKHGNLVPAHSLNFSCFFSSEMHDIAAGTFTYQFYFALVTGKTVQQSFAIAKQTIQAQFGDNSYLRNEANKFVLLPKKADHDEIVFSRSNLPAFPMIQNATVLANQKISPLRMTMTM